jgi:hypothetical protein
MWIDAPLAAADHGQVAAPVASMRDSVLAPLGNVFGIGDKLWSMILSEILLVGGPDRERWIVTGASMMTIDSVLRGFLSRTGALTRFGAAHPCGRACYDPNGGAELIEGVAARIDARQSNAVVPAASRGSLRSHLPFLCAGWDRNNCKGNRIDNRYARKQVFCPARSCDRVPFRPNINTLILAAFERPLLRSVRASKARRRVKAVGLQRCPTSNEQNKFPSTKTQSNETTFGERSGSKLKKPSIS